MRSGFLALLALGIPLLAGAAGQDSWAAAVDRGRREMAAGEYTAALDDFRLALASLDASGGETSAKIVTLRRLSGAARAGGQITDARDSLRRAIQLEEGLSELRYDDLARDLTTAAAMEADSKAAKDLLKRAMADWEKAPSEDGLQELVTVDSLAGFLRNDGEYEEAEALLKRALRTRETAFGPDSANLIGSIDSLSYVLWGQQKYAEAQPLYERLLSLWESSAGKEHPMIPPTLETQAQFHAAQHKYDAAEPLLRRSVEVSANRLMATFQQVGRVYLMQDKIDEAKELYAQAVQTGAECHVPDEVMVPLLRIHSTLLRGEGRTAEAQVIEARINAAAEKQPLRPAPEKGQ